MPRPTRSDRLVALGGEIGKTGHGRDTIRLVDASFRDAARGTGAVLHLADVGRGSAYCGVLVAGVGRHTTRRDVFDGFGCVKCLKALADLRDAPPAPAESPVETSYVVEQHRAFGASSVRFGPFATIDEAWAWCKERGLTCSVYPVNSPTVDTTVGAEVWQ